MIAKIQALYRLSSLGLSLLSLLSISIFLLSFPFWFHLHPLLPPFVNSFPLRPLLFVLSRCQPSLQSQLPLSLTLYSLSSRALLPFPFLSLTLSKISAIWQVKWLSPHLIHIQVVSSRGAWPYNSESSGPSSNYRRVYRLLQTTLSKQEMSSAGDNIRNMASNSVYQ